MNSTRLVRLLVVGSALAFSLAGCTGSSADGAQKVHGLDRLPSETLTDWASYADAVVVATVTAEKEVRQAGDVNAEGEGMTTRELTVRVDKHLWSRTSAPRVPSSFPMAHDGWVIREGDNRSTYMSGDVRLAQGSSYLLALTSFPEGWGPLGSATFAPVDGAGRVADGSWSNPVIEGQEGKAAEAVTLSLSTTAPDPVAAKYFNLGAVERYAAVLKERQAGQG